MLKFIAILFIIIIVILLILLIVTNVKNLESFTSPGWTLTIPPNWFTTRSAKPYNKDEWKTKMYLDRYPFYDSVTRSDLSWEESNRLASVYRFWKQ